MKSNINSDVFDALVPISELNRGGAAKVIDSLDEQSNTKIIMRNNDAVAVLMSVEYFKELVQANEVALKIYTKIEIKNKIKQFIKQNENYKGIEQVFLFGSYARGEALLSSDIDLLVKKDASIKGMNAMALAKQLSNFFQKEVDVIYTSHIPDKLKEEIEQDKVLIYEKKNS